MYLIAFSILTCMFVSQLPSLVILGLGGGHTDLRRVKILDQKIIDINFSILFFISLNFVYSDPSSLFFLCGNGERAKRTCFCIAILKISQPCSLPFSSHFSFGFSVSCFLVYNC